MIRMGNIVHNGRVSRDGVMHFDDEDIGHDGKDFGKESARETGGPKAFGRSETTGSDSGYGVNGVQDAKASSIHIKGPSPRMAITDFDSDFEDDFDGDGIPSIQLENDASGENAGGKSPPAEFMSSTSKSKLWKPKFTRHASSGDTATKKREKKGKRAKRIRAYAELCDDSYFTLDESIQHEKRIPAKVTSTSGDARDYNAIRWRRGASLGSGAFGDVYLGFDLASGELMAVKQVCLIGVENVKKQMRSLRDEIELVSALEHPNIVRYFGTAVSGEYLDVFMEYVAGGSVASLLRRFGSFNESIASSYLKQTLQGLLYLHCHRILHRDIKGGNILVDTSGRCKLADFGASKRMTSLAESANTSLKGTPYWMAPEVIMQIGHGRYADIWSIGCTLIEMLTSRPPYSEFKTPVSAMFQIAMNKKAPQIPSTVSKTARNFMEQCFKWKPVKRSNALKLLQHDFIASSDSSESHDMFSFRTAKISSKAGGPLIKAVFPFDIASPVPSQRSSDVDTSTNHRVDDRDYVNVGAKHCGNLWDDSDAEYDALARVERPKFARSPWKRINKME